MKTNIWKIKILLISTLLVIIGIAGCQTSSETSSETTGPIPENKVGLGADAVFNTPAPATFEFPTVEPGESYLLTRSFSMAPPMVPHSVDEFLPITMENNECMECHDKPKLFDREFIKGKKLAMSRSHYGGFGGAGDPDEVSGSRYTCSQCHAAVSGAEPLVENLF